MNKQDAIKELHTMTFDALTDLVTKLHVEQYGEAPDPNVVLDQGDLVRWILNHYEWKTQDRRWKSKRYILDVIRDFNVITQEDLLPNRLLN
jgi:hypothetical protein